MTCSNPDWEVVIQDSDGYDEAVELVKKLRSEAYHENNHSEDDVKKLEDHLASVEAAIACWDQKQKDKEQQLQEAEELLERLETKRRELVQNGALEAQIMPISIQIHALEAEIMGN